MKIFPAIDLLGGGAVRLTKGDFASAKTYSREPAKLAKSFYDAGSRYLHVVDLDGAKVGASANTEAIARILRETEMALQVGGGIRSAAAARTVIEAGVEKVIIGTLAVKDTDATNAIINEVGREHVTLAFDCSSCDSADPIVRINGWQTSSRETLWHLLDCYDAPSLSRILCTDIDRDGMKRGTNLNLYSRILDRYPGVKIQASGGVASLIEIADLINLGIESCIIGKTLLDGDVSLGEIFSLSGVTC